MSDTEVSASRRVTTDRGVTTIPSPLRRRGAIRPKTELTWVAIESELWLMGPATRHPETVAPAVAAALADTSPFQKLMRRVLLEDPPIGPANGSHRAYTPLEVPELSEDQMVALSSPIATQRGRRGRE